MGSRDWEATLLSVARIAGGGCGKPPQENGSQGAYGALRAIWKYGARTRQIRTGAPGPSVLEVEFDIGSVGLDLQPLPGFGTPSAEMAAINTACIQTLDVG